MRAVLVLVITWMVLVSGDHDESAGRARARQPGKRELCGAQGSCASADLRSIEGSPLPREIARISYPFRLPRSLLVKVEGCDGDPDAFYENDMIMVCYEYIDQLRKTIPPETTAGRRHADRRSSWAPCSTLGCMNSPTPCSICCRLPVLGREEDAADQVSAYIMLQLGKVEARRLIGGIAYAYKIEADAATAPPTIEAFRRRAWHARATLLQSAVHCLRRR